MKELIKNAWLGWLDYTENGKLVALLLLALLLFWFWKKEVWNKYRKLFIYTTIVAISCIIPLTASVLMLYQTKFYDYQWIWGMVPITVVISLASTLLWTELAERYKDTKYAGWKKAGITVLMVCLLYFCGSMGTVIADADGEQQKLEETETLLEIITENGQNTNIVLWAPQSVMEYARAVNGEIRIPYGRNMWDPALNAYSYETYGEIENSLYEWMTRAEETGEGDAVIAEVVLEYGVNHVLLPGNLQPELLLELEEELGIQAELAEGYYWFRIE